jgi:cytochrome c oxidase subunit 2
MIMLVAVPGFTGNQTALAPVGPGAAHIEHTFSLIFWITSTVWLLVLTAVVIAVYRRRYTLEQMPPPERTTEASDRFAVRAVGISMGITVLLLFIMLISSFRTGHAIGTMNSEPQPLTIDVYGHQWWWEVRYPNPVPANIVETANEIHVPVGVPVHIHGTSTDVIHSFWAPNVQGKRDLMPGYDTDLMLQVDKPGYWRGQCAEFCGLQHAHMAFYIIAQPKDEFEHWLEAQAQSAPVPSDPQTQHGQQVFLTHGCVLCHTIGGTTAGSRVGPDLTHLASRSTIAAGTLPNTTGNLAGWILNAQAIKPGCRMPPNQLSGTDLQDLLAYLETLK